MPAVPDPRDSPSPSSPPPVRPVAARPGRYLRQIDCSETEHLAAAPRSGRSPEAQRPGERERRSRGYLR